jgi:hypothetical protein
MKIDIALQTGRRPVVEMVASYCRQRLVRCGLLGLLLLPCGCQEAPEEPVGEASSPFGEAAASGFLPVMPSASPAAGTPAPASTTPANNASQDVATAPVAPKPGAPPVAPAVPGLPPADAAAVAPAVPAAPLPGAGQQGQAVSLSAGVALAQTGPTGILMSFSVDFYRSRQPVEGGRYLWIIERAKGTPSEQPTELVDEGTLQAVLVGWRPEEGPFKTHIEEQLPDGSRRRVSQTLELR